MKMDVLAPSIMMMVTVSASTTSGRPLSASDLSAVMQACDVALQLDAARSKIVDFVTSKMNLLAPNLSAIVASTPGHAASVLTPTEGHEYRGKADGCFWRTAAALTHSRL